jgi:hypothetical protein
MKSKYNLTFCLIFSVFIFLFANSIFAAPTKNHSQPTKTNNTTQTQRRPWGIFIYQGKMTNKRLNQVLRFDIGMREATLTSLELSYKLAKKNILSRIVNYIGADFFVAINGTYQDDPQGNIYEFNPYFGLTWSRFPWNKYVFTALSIGEGVSYASTIPDRELRTASHAENAKKLLNYLMFEAAFALPKYPNFQIAYRIHHRSACFGVYRSSNSGSTAIGIGLRYLF